MQSQLRSCSVNLKTLVDDLLVSQKNNWGQKAQTANILSKLQQQKNNNSNTLKTFTWLANIS